MRTDQKVVIMRRGNDLEPVPYDSNLPFADQVASLSRDPDDKALLKIVNHNDSTFYLESANWRNEQTGDNKDMTPLANLNENMYLVVRSLKHNNTKIVSIHISLFSVILIVLTKFSF